MTAISQVDAAAIHAAAARIAGHVRRTPLLRLPGAALGVDCAELWLKLEHLQRSGSFKARGMFNRMLAQPLPAAGVVVASGGNAGIAVATAAAALGTPCEVFIPEMTSPAKREALSALGARVVQGGAAYADALEACLQRQQATGALLMHAYDQAEVVAGALAAMSGSASISSELSAEPLLHLFTNSDSSICVTRSTLKSWKMIFSENLEPNS